MLCAPQRRGCAPPTGQQQRQRRPLPAAAALAAAARCRPAAAKTPLRVAALAAGTADFSVRVRGDAKRVSYYIADVANSWPAWSPVTKAAVRLGAASAPLSRGDKFELKQSLWGVLDYPMTYTVLELDLGRRVVLSGLSAHHTATEQFVMMPCPGDPGMTLVRFVSEARLRGARAALQPVVARLLRRVPEDGLSALQRLLNGPRSPLLTREFEARYTEWLRTSADVRKGRSGSASGSGSSSGSGSGRHGAAGSGWGSWSFDSLFGGTGKRSSGGSSSSRASAAAPPAPAPVVDAAGHYAALRLEVAAAGGAAPTDEELRSAYRRLVLELHPDRQAGKSAAAQRKAADEFRRVLAAYEALKDPEARALYHAGAVVEATFEL